jgi:hypothetical protein
MPIAVTEEHESLRRTAERWLAAHCPPTEFREVAEAGSVTISRSSMPCTATPSVVVSIPVARRMAWTSASR